MHARRHAALPIPAIQKFDAMAHDCIVRVDVQPEQPFRRPAQRHAELIDRLTSSQCFDLRIETKASIVPNDSFNMPAAIEHAHRMKIQPLRFSNCQNRRAVSKSPSSKSNCPLATNFRIAPPPPDPLDANASVGYSQCTLIR
jgi:hypothetical protein